MNKDYSAFSETVTPEDLKAFKEWRGRDTLDDTRRNLAIALGIFSVIALNFQIYSAVITGSNYLTIMIATIVIFGIIIFSLFTSKTDKTPQVRVYKFARDNNADLLYKIKDPVIPGMIFDRGNSRMTLEALRFKDGTEVGNYTYTTGRGRRTKYHSWGYAKVKLYRSLPHMVLDATSNNLFGFTNLPDSFRGQKLSLEGDFDKHFTLYAPATYARDALYVFTPDVMAALIDSGSDYDIEIIDDALIVFSGRKIALESESSLRSIFSILDTISAEIRDQTKQYSDERVKDSTLNVVAEQGKRLKTSYTLGGILTFIIAAVWFLISFLSKVHIDMNIR